MHTIQSSQPLTCSKIINNSLTQRLHVTVFIELRARFDEEANIDWATALRDAGARVITAYRG